MPFDSVSRSPNFIRALPFVIFIALTFCQDLFGGAGKYWFYLAKTLFGAAMIWVMWPHVHEMRWKISLEAIVSGVLVFVIWVGLDPLFVSIGFKGSYPKLFAASAQAWNPFLEFGAATIAAWMFVVVRIAGSTLIVPPLEEVFFRSWLYRYIANPDFQRVRLGQFLWVPFVVTAVVFGLEHREWLAGILAGVVYGGLVCWKKRLGDAITAHAITNLLLGIWVVTKGQWQYW